MEKKTLKVDVDTEMLELVMNAFRLGLDAGRGDENYHLGLSTSIDGFIKENIKTLVKVKDYHPVGQADLPKGLHVTSGVNGADGSRVDGLTDGEGNHYWRQEGSHEMTARGLGVDDTDVLQEG
ncbi:hypothetical protein ESZ50_01305 [Weissella muntiaci]|uniref:Uncharacterized protein n=1 Tax=Weissella muntiaci TaxID=2508881 RepID=A0A6C2C9U9_9LACO|nr:hypothetical protein [Weissella muntiaci]TYC50881.1 hypothetical protein ESZ50_01305 [Weissella muntiaci]